MQPLTMDDLMPLEEYAGRRKEFFESQRRYLDRYRRIRIGPRLTLLFENRQTLWFRVQEIIRVARLIDRDRIQEVLDNFNQLLPPRNGLEGALIVEPADENQIAQELERWREFQGSQLQMHLGELAREAKLVTCRPEDRCAGLSHWIAFSLDDPARAALADTHYSVAFKIQCGFYQHQSLPLSEEVRQSLLDDLELSDRDDERSTGR